MCMAEKKRFRIEDCFQKEHCSYLRIPIYTKNRNMQQYDIVGFFWS